MHQTWRLVRVSWTRRSSRMLTNCVPRTVGTTSIPTGWCVYGSADWFIFIFFAFHRYAYVIPGLIALTARGRRSFTFVRHFIIRYEFGMTSAYTHIPRRHAIPESSFFFTHCPGIYREFSFSTDVAIFRYKFGSRGNQKIIFLLFLRQRWIPWEDEVGEKGYSLGKKLKFY